MPKTHKNPDTALYEALLFAQESKEPEYVLALTSGELRDRFMVRGRGNRVPEGTRYFVYATVYSGEVGARDVTVRQHAADVAARPQGGE